MIKCSDRLFSHNYGKFATAVKIASVNRLIIKLLANGYAHIWYRLTFNKYRLPVLKKGESSSPRLVVSLTSFPKRINSVWIVIESILRQDKKPDLIILWLSQDQFKSVDVLPSRLLKMQEKGLIIKLCEGDLRSHKKYFYAFKKYPNDVIITVDDDIIYSPVVLSYLINAHKQFPSAVCSNYAELIPTEPEKFYPTNSWAEMVFHGDPSYNIFPVGAGGVLYPPGLMSEKIYDKNCFLDLCKYADDIWLNVVSRYSNIPAVKTSYNSKYIPVIIKKNKTLHSLNLGGNYNDKQFKAIRDYFGKNFNFDPYSYQMIKGYLNNN